MDSKETLDFEIISPYIYTIDGKLTISEELPPNIKICVMQKMDRQTYEAYSEGKWDLKIFENMLNKAKVEYMLRAWKDIYKEAIADIMDEPWYDDWGINSVWEI